jgi:co-chaperonin GroES (HSP10)
MSEEVVLEYVGSSVSKRKDKEGNIVEVFKVKLQDSKKKYTLTISDGSDVLFDKYPEDCEVPIQLNKSSQTKLME